MGETIVISHLLVMGIISLIGNSILLVIIAAFSFFAGIVHSSIQIYFLNLVAIPFYFTLFLFNIPYSVVSIIGSILGSSYRDSDRKIGVVLLIVINSILFPVILANCFITFLAYEQGLNEYHSYPITTVIFEACLSLVAIVSQAVLLIYSIIHIVVICTSFKCRNENRQAEEYQEPIEV